MMGITLQHAAFAAMALIILGSAVMVVSLRNLFHCLLFMALCFVGIAGLYLLLAADFLAAVQVLVYVGAIAVLIMFALMMTHRVMSGEITQSLNQWWLAPFPVALGLFFAIHRVFVKYPWAFAPQEAQPTTGIIGRELMTRWVLPFELASIVLLVAIVGAIVLAKEDRTDDPA